MKGGGGYSDIFIHTYRLGSFFWFKILNLTFFFGGGGGGGQKNEIFCGTLMKILWIFLGSSQNWTIFRGHFFVF